MLGAKVFVSVGGKQYDNNMSLLGEWPVHIVRVKGFRIVTLKAGIYQQT